MSQSLSATSALGNLDAVLQGGDLRDHGVIEILAALHAHQLTAALHVRGPRGDKTTLFVMEGDIIATQTENDTQLLGKRLIRKGLLTADQLTSALSEVDEVHPLGEALLKHKLLGREQLEEALSEQFEDILNSSFLIHEGKYQVEVLDAIFADNLQLLFDTGDLLTEGRKLRDDLSHLLAALSDGDVGLAAGSASGKTPLGVHAREIQRLAEEHRVLDKILDHSPVDRIPTLKIITDLLERRVLAIAKINDRRAETADPGASQLRRDPRAGLFGSDDSVLDKVDLSHVVHFTIATEIPLSGVIETVGIEDLEEKEREMVLRHSMQTTQPRRSQVVSDLDAVEDADDESGEMVFTEDGPLGEADATPDPDEKVERLGAPIKAPAPTPAPRPAPTPAEGRPQLLSPAQKQFLRRRVHVYNRMYQTVMATFLQHERKQEVLARFQSFFRSPGATPPELFAGVEFRADGTLNPDLVLRNLETHPFERPFEVFDQALHAILTHLFREARSIVSAADAEDRLKDAVTEIRKQLFRKGARVPPLG